jgi:hypothetical protein
MPDDGYSLLRHAMRAAAKDGLGRVVFYAGEEILKQVTVKTRGKRWEPIVAIASRLSWTHAELLDRSGAAISLVENSAPAGELAELGAKSSPVVDMVRLVISAQTAALANRDKETTAAMTACTDAVKLLSEAVGTMSKIYQAAIRTALETGSVAAAAEPDESSTPMSTRMIEAALPHVMKRVFEDNAGPPVRRKKEPEGEAA